MKRLLAAVFTAGWAFGAGAQPVLYRFDPQHSFVYFEVVHFGTATLRGRVGPIEGIAELDRGAHRGEVSLSVPTRIVSTGVPALDARLRQPDLFASDDDPLAYFVARHFVFEGEALREVRGEFTLRSISRALTLRALRFGCGPHPMLQREVCGGDFEAELRRSDYGMDFGLPFVADSVRLLVQVEALRDP